MGLSESKKKTFKISAEKGGGKKKRTNKQELEHLTRMSRISRKPPASSARFHIAIITGNTSEEPANIG